MLPNGSGQVEAVGKNLGAAIWTGSQLRQMALRGLGLDPEAGYRKTRKGYHKRFKDSSRNVTAEPGWRNSSKEALCPAIECMAIVMHPGFRRMLHLLMDERCASE
jgi:hypothetical protein